MLKEANITNSNNNKNCKITVGWVVKPYKAYTNVAHGDYSSVVQDVILYSKILYLSAKDKDDNELWAVGASDNGEENELDKVFPLLTCKIYKHLFDNYKGTVTIYEKSAQQMQNGICNEVNLNM